MSVKQLCPLCHHRVEVKRIRIFGQEEFYAKCTNLTMYKYNDCGVGTAVYPTAEEALKAFQDGKIGPVAHPLERSSYDYQTCACGCGMIFQKSERRKYFKPSHKVGA